MLLFLSIVCRVSDGLLFCFLFVSLLCSFHVSQSVLSDPPLLRTSFADAFFLFHYALNALALPLVTLWGPRPPSLLRLREPADPLDIEVRVSRTCPAKAVLSFHPLCF